MSHSAAREATITPLQQLFLFNAPFLHEHSAALVARMEREAPSNAEQRIAWLYPLLFARSATSEEMSMGKDFLTQSEQSGIATQEAWREYAHALLSSNEFLFVD